jgi:hypothetical protein
MTTIAFKAGIVASDSRLTQGGDIMPERTPKVWFSKRHPVIYAGCGMVSQFFGAGLLLDQMENLPWDNPVWRPHGDFDLDDATFMIVTRRSEVYYFEGKFYYPVAAPFFAMGSGSVAARAAMMAGASAEQAVEIACSLDSGSGLPVNIVRVENIPVFNKAKKGRKKVA